MRINCVYGGGVDGELAPPDQTPTTRIDPTRLDAVRACLNAAAALPAFDALPHLRQAAERITALLDETMAAVVLDGQASLRSAAHQAGLTPNAVGPRLGRTHTLGAYADAHGRVTASGVQRARFDHETGTPRPAPETTTAMRFKPRRPS